MNLDGLGSALVERGLKTLGDFDSSANLFVRDLVFPVVRVGNDFDLLVRLQSIDDPWRIFAVNDHDFGNFFFGASNQNGGERNHPGDEDGKGEQGDEDCGDESAAVAEPLGEFLAIDDAYGVKIHDDQASALARGPTTLTMISSRLCSLCLARSSVSVPSSRSLPPWMMPMWSQSRSTSDMICVEKMTVLPRSRQSAMKPMMVRAV